MKYAIDNAHERTILIVRLNKSHGKHLFPASHDAWRKTRAPSPAERRTLRERGTQEPCEMLSRHCHQSGRFKMPLILLWVGVPVVLLGGGYFVIHAMH